MSKKLFISGLSLIIAWTIAVFGFHVNGTIHMLLIIAIITLLQSMAIILLARFVFKSNYSDKYK
ncbi:MAG TPA: DUF5670 family protein [Bacteroidales bacterium]